MKYIRTYDNQIFDETQLVDAVDEATDKDDISMIINEYSIWEIFSNLEENFQKEILGKVRRLVFNDWFEKYEEEEEEDF